MIFTRWIELGSRHLRSFRQTPAVVLSYVLVHGVAIGLSAAIFNLLYTVVLEPLPFPNDDELVIIRESMEGQDTSQRVSYPLFDRWSEQAKTLASLGAWAPHGTGFQLSTDVGTELLFTQLATSSLFSVLGLELIAGRPFTAEETNVGGRAPVAILSHKLWVKFLGKSPDAVGQVMRGPAGMLTIVGVLGPDTDLPRYDEVLWLPFSWYPPDAEFGLQFRFMNVVGRLTKGATPQSAGTELRALTAGTEDPTTGKEIRPVITTLRSHLLGDSGSLLKIVFGCSVVLLFIGIGNATILLLLRLSSRASEFAIRSATGATPGRIARMWAGEIVELSVVSLIIALFVADRCIQAIVSLQPTHLPRTTALAFEMPGTLFAVVATVLLALGLVIVSGAVLARFRPARFLIAAGARGSSGRTGLGKLVIVVQISLAVTLTSMTISLTTQLFERSLVDLGFQADNLRAEVFIFNSEKYRGRPELQLNFMEEVMQQLRGLPAVEEASFATIGFGGREERQISRTPQESQADVTSGFHRVMPGYFDTLKASFHLGRDFVNDKGSQPKVAIINRKLSRSLFAEGNPIGQQLMVFPRGYSHRSVELRVAGVVENIRYLGPHREFQPEIYVPFAQWHVNFAFLLLRYRNHRDSLDQEVKRAIWVLDPDLPIGNGRRVSDFWPSRAYLRPRFYATILAGFAIVALAFLAIGVFAIATYSITLRHRDIAIRTALGESPRKTMIHILKETVIVAVPGALAGIVLSVTVVSKLVTEFFDASPRLEGDVTGSLFALLVCIGAAYLAVRRVLQHEAWPQLN